YACLCVIIDQRLCLLVIYTKSLKYCLRLIIISQDEAAAALIADAFLFCGSIYDMISSSAVNTGSSSGHTVYDILVRDLHIDRIIHLLAHCCKRFVKSLCLRDRTRETIEHISVCTVILLHSVYDQINNQFIRYEQPLIHVGLSLFTKLCTIFDVGTENISCRDMRD